MKKGLGILFLFSSLFSFSSVMIFFLFSFHLEAKQWESLTAECRRLLVESLATMETDNRPELQEKASVLKKTLESLE